MATYEEQRENEMDPNINPLIPGGKASRQAEIETLANDQSPEGVLRREASGVYNPLIITDSGFAQFTDAEGFREKPQFGNYVFSESRQRWFPTNR